MLKTLESKLLKQFPNIIHGTIYTEDTINNTRSPLSFSYSVGDNPEIIDQNYQDFSNYLTIPSDHIKRVKQTHSAIARVVDDPNMPNYHFEADSLVTNLPNICLTITTADCLPILIYAADKNYIANIHAGWRGAKIGIIENTIRKLTDAGCNINNLYAAIMPAINIESYEVGHEFFEDFISDSKDNSQFFIKTNLNNKYLFDLKSYAKSILNKLSINKVDILDYNSFTTDYLFSHRATTIKGNKAGRNLNFIMIKDAKN